MIEKPKRLKRNISFSAHEKDIYDYLNGLDNASAFIKRLVLNHMLMEKGVVAPVVFTPENEKPEVFQEIQKPEAFQEIQKTKEEELELSPDELENQRLLQELDI